MSSIGVVEPELPGDEAGQRHDTDDEGAEHRAAGPAVGVAPHQAEHDPEQADADQADPDQVEPGPRPRDSDSFHQANGSEHQTRPARSTRRCTATTIRW